MTKFKKFRLKKKISKEEIAYKCGVSGRYVDFLEAGRRTPSLAVAYRIAKFLGTTVDELFLPINTTKCIDK